MSVSRLSNTIICICHGLKRSSLVPQIHGLAPIGLASHVHLRRASTARQHTPLRHLHQTRPSRQPRIGSMALCRASLNTSTEGTISLPNMDVYRVPCLSDNYAWLLQESRTGKTAIIDPSEAGPVFKALEARSLKLDFIINTHHHWDHVGGNEELKSRTGARIVGPAADAHRIPGMDEGLSEGDVWQFGNLDMQVFEVPGHTSGHIALWFEDADALFTGDTLFALGCGRLFEGTAEQMWTSLSKFSGLPSSARVFCGHEYTQSNAKFALSIDPSNEALRQRAAEIDNLRKQGQATVPSMLGVERDTNPFLRPDQPSIKKKLGLEDADTQTVFTAIRKAKDKF